MPASAFVPLPFTSSLTRVSLPSYTATTLLIYVAGRESRSTCDYRVPGARVLPNNTHSCRTMLLLVQPEYPPAVGGMQTHAAAMASRLHQRGHRIAVVTYYHSEDPTAAAAYDGAQPYPTFRCLSRLSHWANVRTLLDLVDYHKPDLVYGSTPFYGSLRTMTRIPFVSRSAGNDVMRCWIPYPFRFGSRLLARPAVERYLESVYHRLRAPSWLEALFFQARRQVVQQGARASSAVVANSHYTRDRLLDLGVAPDAVAVVPGGVDTARFSGPSDPSSPGCVTPPGRSPVLLTVCRLVMKKGVDVLLDAVDQARRQLPNLSLIVVGDGPERESCQSRAAELGLKGIVRFVGKVPHDEIVSYYHSADAFVLASRVHRRRRGGSDVETMGRVICEANAAGLPVIATATGGVPSLVAHEVNGLLVPPEDPAALAASVVRLWSDLPLRTRLRSNGMRRAREEFDWDVVVSAYEEIFERAKATPLS
jgi:phosphatidyl-myo-inositol dimannoside synthase